MDRMVYKGYESTPKHDAECGVFYGLVDGIDGLCEYARCGVRFVDIRYADECLGGDSV